MITEFIAHLVAETSNFTEVDHAWTMVPVDKIGDRIPALWVFAGEDDFGEDGTDGLVAKMLTTSIRVYVVCNIAVLDARKSELRGAAIGWSAGANYTDLAPVSGRVKGLNGGVVWWEEIYANRVKITEL